MTISFTKSREDGGFEAEDFFRIHPGDPNSDLMITYVPIVTPDPNRAGGWIAGVEEHETPFSRLIDVGHDIEPERAEKRMRLKSEDRACDSFEEACIRAVRQTNNLADSVIGVSAVSDPFGDDAPQASADDPDEMNP